MRTTTSWLRYALWAALLMGLAIGAAWPWLRPRPEVAIGRTNLVLIVVDTLRADHVGAYGYARPTTTNIDALARDGVVFEQAFANCSWTRPSIASMLTGTYPRQTGVYKERFDALSPDVVPLAAMLQGAGYRTYGVTANPTINAVFGFDRGFDQYGDCGVVWPWMKGRTKYKRGKVRMEDADSVTDRAIEVLETHDDGAFYLQVLYIDPHVPYRPPEDFAHPLNDDPTSSRERYDAEVAFADHELGRLVDWIRERHPDTMFVVTSDHGEGLRDHPGVPRAATHGFVLYDSNVHVPLVFHHASLAGPARFAGEVQLLDVVPTLAELFELPLDEQVRGTSLAPVLRGEPAPSLPAQIFSSTEFNEVEKVAVRERGWKLQINRDHVAWAAGEREDLEVDDNKEVRRLIEMGGPRELYRLPGTEHPGENQDANLADDPAHADTLRRLEAAIAGWEAAVPPRPPINRDRNREVDSTVIDQLKALGYLE